MMAGVPGVGEVDGAASPGQAAAVSSELRPLSTGSPDMGADRVLGLDGTPQGWMAVVLCDGQLADAFVATSASEALAGAGPAVVAADMPLGLVDRPVRDADAAVRRQLAGAASTVFNPPPRAVVEAWRRGEVTGHAEATAMARAVTGSGLSRQAWSLVAKIAELDALAVTWGDRLVECHPELVFRQLAGGRLPRKRSWDGLMRRRGLLAGAGVAIPDALGSGGERAGPDDVLDAAACAWVAAGLAAGEALQAHPPDPRQQDRGRPIAVWSRPPPASALRSTGPYS